MDKLKKLIPHILILIAFCVISFLYMSPASKGKVLQQGDIQQWSAAAGESMEWKEKTGELPLWNSRMFGGMPTYQITGTNAAQPIGKFYAINFPHPINFLMYFLICSYIMFLCFRLGWKLALFGALGLTFASYNFIIIEAGHNTKALAIALTPLVIGAVALLLNRKYLLGAALLFLGMSMKVSAGH